MKVLLTATVQSHICQFHRPLAEMLHEHGCEVHVAARDNLSEKNGLKLDFADKAFNVAFARSPISKDNGIAYRQLKHIIKEEHYDIIHCNTPMGGIVTRLAARKARKSGTKVFYTAHGFHFYNGAAKKNWVVFYPIEKAFSHITDKLITINHEDYALASKKFHSDTYYIHGVGVDECRYYPWTAKRKGALRDELGYSLKQKVILCVGELLPNKNQAMAIRAMKLIAQKYPDAVLLIAGNGPEKENLVRLIESIGLRKSVKLLGYCTCLEKYQQIADILVSCSRREGLPLNVVEAMLSENPVVASKNRGHCELVQCGETGYLVDIDDFEMMAKYVIRLLDDSRLNAAMGAKARKFAKQYGVICVRQELEQIYYPGKNPQK